MKQLLIDTSTERGSVAYFEGVELLFLRALPQGAKQSRDLMPVLQEALSMREVELIGVTVGPGSYTGMRVGIAAAQGLAYSLNVPLVPLSSLVGFAPSKPCKSFAAVVDARIGGVYLQKGERRESRAFFEAEPRVLSVEEALFDLDSCSILVSPSFASLELKFKQAAPEKAWIWEERAPDPYLLHQALQERFDLGCFYAPPSLLPIYYLRETQAEQEKRAKASA